MYSFDVPVQNYFSLTRTPILTDVMYTLTTFFDASWYFILLVICFTILIFLIRNFRYALLFFSTLLFGTVIVYILKNIFNIARPLDGFMSVFSSSFPSYHATSATIFFVILIYIFDSCFRSRGRVIFNTICLSGIMLVAFSRLYLGVHWLSDVLFGIILGVLISYISIFIFKSVMFRQNNRLNMR